MTGATLLLAALQAGTSGPMAVHGGRIDYKCETAILLNEEAGKTRFVSAFEKARRFELTGFDDSNGQATLVDPLVGSVPLSGTLEVSDPFRVLAFGMRSSTGQDVQIDLVMNLETESRATFLEKVTYVKAAGATPRIVTRSGTCNATIVLEPRP